jgi:predicted glutamine amidotransferase
MCGIWGILPRNKSGLFKSDSAEAKQMMLDTAKRGEHSTGIFMTEYKDPKAHPTGVKVIGGPHNICYQKSIWEDVEAFLGQHAGSMVGHGRHATRGKISGKNAHPFQHDHITLVHNGTLYSGVSYQKKGDTEIEVDSHALCVAMAEKGIAEALTDIHGAYAIIAHDAKEGAIYFARNKERPLHIYSSKTRHYLMSEFPYLWALVQSYNKVDDKEEKVWLLGEEQLYKVDLNSPDKYEIVSDLKALRKKKEDDRRAIEEQERKNRAAEWERNRPPQTQIGYPGGTKKSRMSLDRSARTVLFTVKTVEAANDGNYRYTGLSKDGVVVWFLTDSQKLDYIEKEGTAKVHSVGYKDTVPYYFVKHRGITWVEEVEDTEGTANQSGYFLTANRKRLDVDVWHRRCLKETCINCDTKFKSWDSNKVVLTDDDKLLCSACWSMFAGTKPGESLPTIN